MAASYKAYFTAGADPPSLPTLLGAAISGVVPHTEAKAFIADEMDFLSETRLLIREQANNGIDTVPHIMIQGKKREFTLEGATETKEYLKALKDVGERSYLAMYRDLARALFLLCAFRADRDDCTRKFV